MSTLAWLLVAFGVWLIVLAFALSLGKSAKDADAMIERWFKVVPVVLLFILLFPLTTSFMSPDARGTHWIANLASLLIATIYLIISNIFIRQRISKGWL